MVRFRLFVLYLFIYFVLVSSLFLVFSRLNFIKVVSRRISFRSWGLVVFFLLRLSGLPPFSIFYLKVGVLLCLVDFYFFIPFLLLGSLLSIYYYLTFIIGSLPSVWGESNFNGGLFMLFFLLGFLYPFVLLLS